MPAEWAGTAAAYAASFALLCAGTAPGVLDAVEERWPERGTLLDVGTGTGVLARAGAARGWEVTACDPEPGMLRIARRLGGGVDYRDGALPALPFPDGASDVVLANFVLPHTHRPRAAVAELVRVARGVVALTVWPRRRTVLNGLWAGIVADAGAHTPPSTTIAAEHDIDRTVEGLTEALTIAGLAAVGATTIEWEFAIDPGVLWSGVVGGAGTIGTTYLAQAHATRAAMEAAYRARTEEIAGEDGLLRLPSFGLLGVGVRADG